MGKMGGVSPDQCPLKTGFTVHHIGQITYLEDTVKPVFKGHLYMREKVSLHDRCPFVTGSLTWEGRTPF